MLAGRTGFNDEALEDAYIWGLPHLILQKVFTQTTLPKGLDGWKTIIRNLDRLHRGLMELKYSTAQPNLSSGCSSQLTGHTNASATASTSQSPQVIMSPQTSDTSAPRISVSTGHKSKPIPVTTATSLDISHPTAPSLKNNVFKTLVQSSMFRILWPKLSQLPLMQETKLRRR